MKKKVGKSKKLFEEEAFEFYGLKLSFVCEHLLKNIDLYDSFEDISIKNEKKKLKNVGKIAKIKKRKKVDRNQNEFCVENKEKHREKDRALPRKSLFILEEASISTSKVECKLDKSASCNERTFSNIDSDLSHDDKPLRLPKCRKDLLGRDDFNDKIVDFTSRELNKFSFDDGYNTIDSKVDNVYRIDSDVETTITKLKKDNTRLAMYFTREIINQKFKMPTSSPINENAEKEEKISINFNQNNYSLGLNNDVKTITNNYLTKTQLESEKVIKFNNNNSNIQKLISLQKKKPETKRNNVKQITKKSITKRKTYKLHLNLFTTILVEEDYSEKKSLIITNSKTFYKNTLNIKEPSKITDHKHWDCQSSAKYIEPNDLFDACSKKSTKNQQLLDISTLNINENELKPYFENPKLDENNNFTNNIETSKPSSLMADSTINKNFYNKEIRTSNQPPKCEKTSKNDLVGLKEPVGKDCFNENFLKNNDKNSFYILQDYSLHDTFDSLNNNNISSHETSNKPTLTYTTYCKHFKMKFKKKNHKRKIKILSLSEIFPSGVRKIQEKNKVPNKDYCSLKVDSETLLNWDNDDVFGSLLDDDEENFIESNVDDDEKIDLLINFNNNNDDSEVKELTDDSSDTITNEDKNICSNNSKVLGEVQANRKNSTNISRPPSSSSLKTPYTKFQKKPSSQLDAGDKNSVQSLALDNESDKLGDQKSINEINFTRSTEEGPLTTIVEDNRSETDSNIDTILEKSFINTNSFVNKSLTSSQREKRTIAVLSEKTQEIKRCLKQEEIRINNINQNVKKYLTSKHLAQQKITDIENETSIKPISNHTETLAAPSIKNMTIPQKNKSHSEISYKARKSITDQSRQTSTNKEKESKQSYSLKVEPSTKMSSKSRSIVSRNTQRAEQLKSKFISGLSKQKLKRGSPLKYRSLLMDRIESKTEKTLKSCSIRTMPQSTTLHEMDMSQIDEKTESFSSTQSDQIEKIEILNNKKKLTNEHIKVSTLYFPKPETHEISTNTSVMHVGSNKREKDSTSFKIEELFDSDFGIISKEQNSGQVLSVPHYVPRAKLNDFSMNDTKIKSMLSHEESFFSAQTQQKPKTSDENTMPSSQAKEPSTFYQHSLSPQNFPSNKNINSAKPSVDNSKTPWEDKEKFLKETTLDPKSNKTVSINELGPTNKDVLKIFKMTNNDLLNEKNVIEVLEKTKKHCSTNEDQVSKSVNTKDKNLENLDEKKEHFKKKLIKETKKKCLLMEKNLINQTKERMKFLHEGLEETVQKPSPVRTDVIREPNMSPKIETAITFRNKDTVYKEKHLTLIEDIKRRRKIKKIQETLQKRKESELRSARLFRTNVFFVAIGRLFFFLHIFLLRDKMNNFLISS